MIGVGVWLFNRQKELSTQEKAEGEQALNSTSSGNSSMSASGSHSLSGSMVHSLGTTSSASVASWSAASHGSADVVQTLSGTASTSQDAGTASISATVSSATAVATASAVSIQSASASGDVFAQTTGVRSHIAFLRRNRDRQLTVHYLSRRSSKVVLPALAISISATRRPRLLERPR